MAQLGQTVWRLPSWAQASLLCVARASDSQISQQRRNHGADRVFYPNLLQNLASCTFAAAIPTTCDKNDLNCEWRPEELRREAKVTSLVSKLQHNAH
ncbi:hypothetical protein HPB47_018441 [Ixodes persulcatus]|uniref:Uncharacterized protein n=1 Tax=Ixodes persulcatus TaxID=34615 RepID=A0AC60QKP6_IXOPE|nr:hypothetical protein HPB47_018441 [Ixodes persulcatus]